MKKQNTTTKRPAPTPDNIGARIDRHIAALRTKRQRAIDEERYEEVRPIDQEIADVFAGKIIPESIADLYRANIAAFRRQAKKSASYLVTIYTIMFEDNGAIEVWITAGEDSFGCWRFGKGHGDVISEFRITASDVRIWPQDMIDDQCERIASI